MTEQYDLRDYFPEDCVDSRLDAQQAISKLDHLDRAILYLWVMGYSHDDIGQIVGYTPRHIGRILSKLCNK